MAAFSTSSVSGSRNLRRFLLPLTLDVENAAKTKLVEMCIRDRVYRMLRDQMKSVYVELRRLRSADGIDERLIELMQVLTRVFVDLGADELGAVGDDVAQQDAAVLRMARG